MKTKLKVIISLVTLLLTLVLLTSCFGPEELTVEAVYAMAQESGYTGTLEDFIKEFKGETGTGLQSATVNEENHLVITLTDGTVLDCGQLTVVNGKDGAAGADGAPGQDGKNGSVVTLGANGNWFIDGVDTGVSSKGAAGEKGQKGDTGLNGKDGKDGKDGSAWISGSGAPSSLEGKDGDIYLDTATYDVYQKTSGTWSIIANFSSAAGGGGNTSFTPEGIARAVFSSVMLRVQSADGRFGASGSGIIYQLDKESGTAYIITNHHVVYNPNNASICESIKAYIYGYQYNELVDTGMSCEYIGGALNEDVAVLRITGAEILRSSNACAAELESSKSVSVSDEVIVVGNAQGLGISATHGRVSVNVEDIGMLGSDNETAITVQCLRIDAPVNHGNSGGGLYNKDGRLIGLINAKMENMTTGGSVDNIGFAIPVDKAVAIAENIMYFCEGTSDVSPKTFYPGAIALAVPNGASVNPITGKLELHENLAVYYVDSAYAGKLAQNDVILKVTIGSKEYTINRSYELNTCFYLARPGDVVKITVSRGGGETVVTLNTTASNFLEVR